jgi:hypothetical protein
MAGTVTCTGELGNAYTFSGGKPKGKRPLGRHRRKWKDTIKNHPKEKG